MVVVFSSKYGFTKRYAKWISTKLKCDLFDLNDISLDMLGGYKTVIYGGGLYAGGVSNIKRIAKWFNANADKNLVIFTCGLANPQIKENADKIDAGLKTHFLKETWDEIAVFHLQGGIDYKKLTPIHRAMMAALYRVIARKGYENLSDEDKKLVDTYGQRVNYLDIESINPIVDYVKSL